MANVRSAIAVTIALALPFALLLALVVAGAGFHGDPHAVLSASSDRLAEVAPRRGPAIGVVLLVWLGAFLLAMAASRERAGRPAARLLALSLAYLPLLSLAAAALQPGVEVERLLFMLGAPALAAATLLALGGYRALAFACGATALAFAVDVVAGSPLSRLSLVGPNPAAGHRFYGIGNELEAALVVLILVGTGAALSALAGPADGEGARRRSGRRAPPAFAPALAPATLAPAAFLLVAAFFAFVLAYGRFGADVGAAIALPLGAAVAAALCAGRPRLALLALAVPLPALAILAAADLLSGADAHLTRSVLQAGSGDDVAAVLGRRLREAGESFGRPLLLAVLPFVLAAAAVAWLGRDRLAAWLRDRPPMRAAMLGALAAVLVGTVANDSGALLLEIGAVYLAVFAGFAWAEAGPQP